MKRILTKKRVCLFLIGAAGLVVFLLLGYLVYLFVTYKRLPDNLSLLPKKGEQAAESQTEPMQTGETVYSVLTYNIGFGAYVPEFSFFMDGGNYSRAFSKEAVLQAVKGSAEVISQLSPDFVVLQEVDQKATRSYFVDQSALFSEQLPWYDSVFALNYDSAYLLYPLHEPHGKSKAGLASYAKYPIDSAIRKSIPVATDFSKFFDLDRCYTMTRIPTEKNELVLVNVHLSAYTSDEAMRNQQMEILFQDLEAEYAKGNYVICGGDFNRDLKADWTQGTYAAKSTWAQPFDRNLLPDGFLVGVDLLDLKTFQSMSDTNRDAGMPYEPGVTATYTLDGFLFSDNVKMLSYETIDLQYKYSDHNPVYMTFQLLE